MLINEMMAHHARKILEGLEDHDWEVLRAPRENFWISPDEAAAGDVWFYPIKIHGLELFCDTVKGEVLFVDEEDNIAAYNLVTNVLDG